MKRILIVASDMEIGGAERALLGLLDAIDTKKYTVDLFLLRHQGPFMKFIPKKINLLSENKYYSDLGVPIGKVIRKGHIFIVIGRALGKWCAKHYIKKNTIMGENSVQMHYSFRYTRWLLPPISNKEYDLAIGFTVPFYIVNEKVKAKHTAVWLHTDYSQLDGNRKEEYKVWSAYEHIVSISPEVTKTFLLKFPRLSKRIVEIENIVSSSFILEQSKLENINSEMPMEKGVIRFLSIGRFVPAKNFDNIPDICKRIIQKGFSIKWYIIGFGADEAIIRKKISEAHMENNVILLGKKENPYPYIRNCDFYIQPSRFEGKAVSVREAQILEKPVIITSYPTAKSQLEDGIDGFIVPLDNESCATHICKIISDNEKCNLVISNLKKRDYSNASEVEKILMLM